MLADRGQSGAAPGARRCVAFWNGHYFVWGAAFALGLGVFLLIPLVAIALARIDEIAAIAFGRAAAPACDLTAAGARSLRAESVDPPAGLLRAAGDAVRDARCGGAARLSRISNAWWSSTTRPTRHSGSRSRRIAATLGERFKFLRLENLEGYKAGALRIALEHTAPDAEIIGVIDADYVVAPRLAQGSGAAVRRSRASASCRRRRIIATATAR